MTEEMDRHYLCFIDMSQDMVVVHHQGKCLYVNPAGLQMLLVNNLDTMVGRLVAEFLYPHSHPFINGDIKAIKAGNIQPLKNPKAVRFDGTVIDVGITASPLVFQGLEAIQLMVHDASDKEKYREVNNRVNAIIEAAPLGIIALDCTGRVRSWNKAAEKIFGWKAEEILGEPYPTVPKEAQKEFYTKFHLSMDGNLVVDSEVKRQKKDGSLIDIMLNTAPVRNKRGLVVGTMAVIADISERKAAEENLRKSEEKFRMLFKNAGDAAILFNLDEMGKPGKYMEINDVACEKLGYTQQELQSMNIRQILPPAVLDKAPRIIKQLLRKKKISFEMDIAAKTNEIIPFEVTAHLFRLGDQQVVLCLARDIKERRAFEAALKESNEKLYAIIKYSPLAISVMSGKGEILDWNKRAEVVFGWPREEVLGSFYPMVDENCKKEFYSLKQRVLKGEVLRAIEIHRRNRTGDTLCLRLFSSPLHSVDGKITGMINIYENITEKKRAEAEIMEARSQLEEATRIASMGALAAGIAHEINQPLNSIKIITDSILYWHRKGKTPSIEKMIDKLEKISAQINKTSDTIQHIRSILKQDNNREPALCEVHEALEGAVNLVGAQMERQGVKIKKCHIGKTLYVWSRPGALELIVVNLLVNAMQAFGDVENQNKEILCRTEESDDYILLEISDNASGLTINQLEHLFNPFFTTKEGEGMGVGLFLVHSLVTEFGGSIFASNNEKGGATFIVKFRGPSLDKYKQLR